MIQDLDFEDFNAGITQIEVGINEKQHPSTNARSFPIGFHEGISNADYHEAEGESSSNLKPMLRSSALYREARSGQIPRVESPAMRLGSAVHKLTLERLGFGLEYVVSRKFGRSAKDQAEKAELHAAHPSMIIIDNEVYDQARCMADSLQAYPEVMALEVFKDGKPEVSGFYTDPATGMLCKYRPDWATDWALFDVKSTQDASSGFFARQMAKFKYPLSAAHYLEGDKELNGSSQYGVNGYKQFIFLCVEPEYPYECAVYQLGEQSLELGQWQRKRALAAIKAGRDSGEWPKLNGGIGQILDVPQYELYEMQKEKV
jgi:PDDEXK-like domain of unknown function (DUF3799)